MQSVREQDGNAARALELVILTAARTSEVINARWDEVDLNAKVWTIPPERMKSKREHRIPLSDTAVKVLKAMQDWAEGEYVFAGGKPDRPIERPLPHYIAVQDCAVRLASKAWCVPAHRSRLGE
jgi:integrase